MERIKPRRQSRIVFLSPAARGWRLRAGPEDLSTRIFPTLDEAAAAIPPDHAIHLALPASAVLIERMRLHATHRAELLDMMRLQLEKTLPFSADETTSELEVIEQSENESLVLAIAVNNEQLDALCKPMRNRLVLPDKITVFALHLATRQRAGGNDCAIYSEDGKIVFAIFENGKLGYVQTLSVADADDFFAELPQLLLGMELDGVPVAFGRVRLDQELAAWSEKARAFFGVPIELISLAEFRPEPPENLVPAQWQRERVAFARASRRQRQLILVGAVYLALLLLAAGAIFILQKRVEKINEQVRAAQPQIDLVARQKAKWLALMPATDPSRYPVEILLQVFNSRPSDDILLTKFSATPAQLMIDAEAPNASAAVDFGERIKKNPALSDFSFQIGPPAILPNEHAQLQVFGKL